MSKIISKKTNSEDDKQLLYKLGKTKDPNLNDFYTLQTTAEKGLWILLICQRNLGIDRLTADQISLVAVEYLREPISSQSIISAFNRLKKDYITVRKVAGTTYYSSTKKGDDYILSRNGKGKVNVFYFESGKNFSNKREFVDGVLLKLKGDFSIVDPYCGLRTLDLLSRLKKRGIRFISKKDRIDSKEKVTFSRELKDYCAENPNAEFRDYPNRDIHDRYIISSDALVLIGHSIKNLGEKETFAVVLEKKAHQGMYDTLRDNFEAKWKISGSF